MCMSVGFFFAFCIWLVLIVCGYLLIKLILPRLLAQLGGPGTLLAQALNIILWGAMMILVLYILWDLVECLIGSGGVKMPALPRR